MPVVGVALVWRCEDEQIVKQLTGPVTHPLVNMNAHEKRAQSFFALLPRPGPVSGHEALLVEGTLPLVVAVREHEEPLPPMTMLAPPLPKPSFDGVAALDVDEDDE